MTMNTKRTANEFGNLVPVFEVELTRQREIPIKAADTAEGAAEILHAMLDKSPVEQMVVLYLDVEKNVIGAEKVGIGSVTSVGASFSTIMRGAIVAGVEDIIVGHNHTIGAAYPSDPDLQMTGMALTIGSILGIRIYDHIIVSPDGTHYSMFDNRHKNELVTRVNRNRVLDLLHQLSSKDPLATPLF